MDRSEVARVGTRESSISPSNSLDPQDFLPSIDWDGVLRMVSARSVRDSDDTGEDEEYVSARLFQLEGEIVVALDASEGARATVLTSTQEEADPVKRMSVTDIEPGMFLLVRNEGGGEYIVLVADRFLREHAARAREVQRYWKDQLRRKVRVDGLRQVVNDLKNYGSRRANYVNLRNWMSHRTIKTGRLEGFPGNHEAHRSGGQV